MSRYTGKLLKKNKVYDLCIIGRCESGEKERNLIRKFMFYIGVTLNLSGCFPISSFLDFLDLLNVGL